MKKGLVGLLALTFLLLSASHAYVDTPQQREQEALAVCLAHIDAYCDAWLFGEAPDSSHLALYDGPIRDYVQIKLIWLSRQVTDPATYLQQDVTVTQEEEGDQRLVTVWVRWRSTRITQHGTQFQFRLARKGHGYQILDVLTLDSTDIPVRGLGPQSTLEANPITPEDVEELRVRQPIP